MNKKRTIKYKYVILLSAILLPYALNGQEIVDHAYADVSEQIVILDGNKIKKMTTNDWQEVPESVKSNPDFYHFMDELVQQGQIGIITSNQTEAEGQLNFQTITKADDYTLGEVIKGLAPDAEHYVILPEQLLGHHSQLGLNDLNDLLKHYQNLNSDIKIEKSEAKSEYLTGEYSDLPTYVRNNPDPSVNYGLKITEGKTFFTTDKKLAQSQPNFAIAPFTTEDLANAIPGKADADKLASGDLTQLPDEEISSKSYTTAEHKQNLKDMGNGLVTLGSVDKMVTSEKETDSLSEAQSHDRYKLKGNKPVGEPQKTKPEGKLGINYELTGKSYLADWQFENVTSLPKNGVTYDDVTSNDYDETKSRARFWEKNSENRENVTFADLQADFDAGLIIKDVKGKRLTSMAEAAPILKNKKVKPYDFNPNNLITDFPEALEVPAPSVDLLSGTHIKETLAIVPEEVGDNYAKKEVYIKDLYTDEGVLIKEKLKGQEGVDYQETPVLEKNGARKLVTGANLHQPGQAESLENEGINAEEGKVYEYWERDAAIGRYKKTQWKYIVSDVPDITNYHKHELDTSQDSYNNGVGTATTWYQLNGTLNFENNVANSIKTGIGNVGGIDSWAISMMGFRPVKNTAESELLKSDPNNQNILPNGRVSKDKLLYRTTVQQYGQGSLNTPPSEVLNGYIYMELVPYINPNTGAQAIDGRGEPVFIWNKFYYTNKEEYALTKISAFDYGYEIEEDDTYTYTVAEPQYQTREELPYYQQLAPIYGYTDDLYSYTMKKHTYLPTKYAYREDSLSWETYELKAYQPSYQEKLYTPWYSYDLPEIRKYSWQITLEESETEEPPPTEGGETPPPTEGGETPPPTEGGETPPTTEGGENLPTDGKKNLLLDTKKDSHSDKNLNKLPETGSLDNPMLSMFGAIALFVASLIGLKRKKTGNDEVM